MLTNTTQNIANTTTAIKKERNSNLELFRIISMFLIVAHHYVVNSGLTGVGSPINTTPTSPNSIFLLLFGAWGKIGINCFMMITGYFMCTSQITLKKYIKLLFEVYFYRLIILGVFIITGYTPISISVLAKAFIPILDLGKGFTAAFLVFYLFIPFLNILVRNMTEKQHIALLLLCSFAYIFLGTVPGFSVTFNYATWFSVLYLISSYIRLYPKRIFSDTKFWGFATLIIVFLSVSSVVTSAWLGTKIGKTFYYFFVTDSNALLAVLTGLSTFMFFKNLKIPYSKFINTVGATTFGVLLIHANSDAMRKWLWRDTLRNVDMYNSIFCILHAILSVIAVFVVCSLIDFLRIKFIEKPFFVFYDKIEPKFLSWYKNLENECCEKLNIK